MFVRWDCGCVGLLLQVGEEKEAWVITGCDRRDEYDEYSLWRRDGNLEKTYRPLSNKEFVELSVTLRRLLADGQKMAILRACLGIRD